MNSILTRRSIRRYKDKEVEQEKIEKILRAAMQAPSAWSQKAWEFIVIRDKEKLQALSKLNIYTTSIASSSVSIIVLANEDRMKSPEFWQQDLGACTQNILLEATELDLGAVWLGVSQSEEGAGFIRKMFNLPAHIHPYSIVSIGYPLDGQGNKFVDRYDETRIHNEVY